MSDCPQLANRDTQSLEQRLADYRWLFDTAEVATTILDQDGKFLDSNRAYYRLMGYQPVDEVGFG